jgi:hypothetical protein
MELAIGLLLWNSFIFYVIYQMLSEVLEALNIILNQLRDAPVVTLKVNGEPE